MSHARGAVPRDASLECIARITGKPVLVHEGVDDRYTLEPCPTSREALTARLADDTLRLFDGLDFAFLMAARYLPPWSPDLSPYAPRMKWSRVRITWAVRPTTVLAPRQAHDVARTLLTQARSIPLVTTEEAAADGSVEIALNVSFVAAGSPSANEMPVVAIIDRLPLARASRLVYGTLSDGSFRPIWDSPLFRATNAIALLDVTGDGLPEIVIESSTGGNQSSPILVIVDIDGREMTRQRDCDAAMHDGFTERDGVCAIRGVDVELSDDEEGPRSIEVRGWSDGSDRTFRLENGRFVPGPPRR